MTRPASVGAQIFGFIFAIFGLAAIVEGGGGIVFGGLLCLAGCWLFVAGGKAARGHARK